MEANPAQPGAVPVTMGGLIDRYVADKLPERYSTRSSYLSCLNVHIRPRWGEHTLQRIAAAPFRGGKLVRATRNGSQDKRAPEGRDAPSVRVRHEVGLVSTGQESDGTRRDQGRDETAEAAAGPHA